MPFFLRRIPAVKGDVDEDLQHLIDKNGEENFGDELKGFQAREQRLKRTIQLLSVVTILLSVAFIAACYYGTSIYIGNFVQSTPVPKMPTRSVTFAKADLFTGPSSQENDQAWNSLTPPGDGFVLVPHPARYRLPPGQQAPGGHIYDITLFHQLHCLASIRAHILLLRGAERTNDSARIHNVLIDPQEDHVYHCLDYIRQGLMCAGDLTLEFPREELDGSRFAFDGWGVEHQCKSWDAIMDFMSKHDPSSIFDK